MHPSSATTFLDWATNLYAKVFYRKPLRAIHPKSFLPMVLTIGGRHIRWNETHEIEGDYNAFVKYLNSIQHDEINEKEKLMFVLLLYTWAQQRFWKAQHQASIPNPSDTEGYPMNAWHSGVANPHPLPLRRPSNSDLGSRLPDDDKNEDTVRFKNF